MDHRLVKNRFQRCPVPAFHKFMVPKIGVVVKEKDVSLGELKAGVSRPG